MKKADLEVLKQALANLPTDLKKYIADYLLEQLNAQADTLVETTKYDLSCPHCGHERPVKWGRSCGLQRYRCGNQACHKTFNALTGTPLTKLHNRDKWLAYLQCMQDSLTLRKSAARVGIDLKTAFRWRHRFLQTSARNNSNDLSGIVEVDETFFLESCKGKRHLAHRASRKRGGQGSKNKKEEKISVVIVRDRSGRVSDLADPHLCKSSIHAFLAPIIDHDSILCSDGHSWYKTFSRDHDIAHHRLITLDNRRVIGKEYHIQNVNNYISRLKRWMVRFNGVATAYLPNYLAWMRLFETEELSEKVWLSIAINANQQRMPT